MNEKNYLGNGWENTQYELVNVSINLEKLNALIPDSYGNVRITVAKMKQPNAKSKATHAVYENNYIKPVGNEPEKPKGISDEVKETLPF